MVDDGGGAASPLVIAIVACWLCALTLLASGPACAEDFPLKRDSWAKTESWAYACREADNIDRLFDLVQEHDEEAAARFFMEHEDCTRLPPETIGKIEDVSVFHWRYCFRPRGEPDCVWAKASSISAANAPAPSPSSPDQCDRTAQAIASATDATRVEKNSDFITLKHDANSIEVWCTDGKDKYLGIASTVSVGAGDQPISAVRSIYSRQQVLLRSARLSKQLPLRRNDAFRLRQDQTPPQRKAKSATFSCGASLGQISFPAASYSLPCLLKAIEAGKPRPTYRCPSLGLGALSRTPSMPLSAHQGAPPDGEPGARGCPLR